MELIAESEMKITSVIPIPGGSTLVSEGNVGKYGKVFASHNLYSNSATKNAGNFDGEARALIGWLRYRRCKVFGNGRHYYDS